MTAVRRYTPAAASRRRSAPAGIAYDKVIAAHGARSRSCARAPVRSCAPRPEGTKLPALKLPDGPVLVHSRAILAWIDEQRHLAPEASGGAGRLRARRRELRVDRERAAASPPPQRAPRAGPRAEEWREQRVNTSWRSGGQGGRPVIPHLAGRLLPQTCRPERRNPSSRNAPSADGGGTLGLLAGGPGTISRAECCALEAEGGSRCCAVSGLPIGARWPSRPTPTPPVSPLVPATCPGGACRERGRPRSGGRGSTSAGKAPRSSPARAVRRWTRPRRLLQPVATILVGLAALGAALLLPRLCAPVPS